MSVFGVFLVRYQSECEKTRTRITSNTDTFHSVKNIHLLIFEKKKTETKNESLWESDKIALSKAPQESILGPTSCNIFIINVLFLAKEAELAKFADDNAIYAARKDIKELLNLLEKESEAAVNFFSDNNMNVNPKSSKQLL